MATYKHIIWDWNGTLLDDAWLSIEVINELLDRRKLTRLTPESYEAVFDFPVQNYYARIGFDFDKEPFDIPAEEFILAYNERRCRCPLQTGAREQLEQFHRNGRVQSILSAYIHDLLMETVAHYGLSDYFDHISGLDNHYAASKVDLGLKLLEDAALDPHATVMVGDTVHDVEVAHAMGIDAVLVYSGHQSLPRLQATGVPVFESLAALDLS